MNRRHTIKNLFLSTGALVALPAWAHGWSPANLMNDYDLVLADQEEMLASLVDTILPAGEDGMGGIKVGVDKFLMKLLDRCYEVEVQENVKTQMLGLETRAQTSYGKAFHACDAAQRVALFAQCGQSDQETEKSFFELIKSETIRGFRTSREVMIKYYKYRVAPGYFHGCVGVETQ